MYDHYKRWKKRVTMVMDSALDEETDKAKCNYLKFWLGEEGLPLIQKWEDTGKVGHMKSEGDADPPSGHNLNTYWELLEEEFKPKANKIISIIELWGKNSNQGSTPLNEWITKVYNMVELCDYEASKERIIRDILITGCESKQAKDKIICKGEKITLKEVLEILQIEDSTSKTLQNIDSTMKNIHYARYDKKKSGCKGGKPKGTGASGSSTMQNSNSTSTSGKVCYRCRKPWNKEHNKVCPAKQAPSAMFVDRWDTTENVARKQETFQDRRNLLL